MKKAKVDRLMRQARDEGYVAGVAKGKQIESNRWRELFPVPHDGMVYLDREVPKEKIVHLPRGSVYCAQDLAARPLDSYHPYNDGHYIRFLPVPMGIAMSNGAIVRWYHWKPDGPFEVFEMGRSG